MDAVLLESNIPTSNVRVVVTDNGSNSVAAFRTYLAVPTEEDDDSEDEVSHEYDERKHHSRRTVVWS